MDSRTAFRSNLKRGIGLDGLTVLLQGLSPGSGFANRHRDNEHDVLVCNEGICLIFEFDDRQRAANVFCDEEKGMNRRALQTLFRSIPFTADDLKIHEVNMIMGYLCIDPVPAAPGRQGETRTARSALAAG